MLEKHYRLKEAAKLLGISVGHLRLLLKKGEIHSIRTSGGHRRIPESILETLLNAQGTKQFKVTRAVIYARVSSQKQAQAGHLERQIERLKTFTDMNGFQIVDIISDVASGLNEKRTGLKKVLDYAHDEAIDVVVIEFRDRLARYGYRYLERFLKAFKVEILEKEQKAQSDYQQELLDDMTSIIYSFAGRLYGHRSKKFRQVKQVVQQEFTT